MAYKKKLNRATNKVDADLKNSEAVAKTDQADAATDPFLDLTERERKAVMEYLNSVTKKHSVRFKISDGKFVLDHSSAPIPDPILMNAFGSTDAAFIDGIINQLASAAPDGFGTNLRDLNFSLSVINGIAPKSPLQTMIVAQMIPVHAALMKYARHVELGGSGWVDEASAARNVSKLAHTFVSQIEAFLRLRIAEEKVAQHVSMTAGDQAIVGNGMQAPGEMAVDRKAGAPARAALAGTNVVRMPERSKQAAKGAFRRRPTK
jgi:hypothetical protein